MKTKVVVTDDINVALAQLVQLHENVLSRVLAIQSLLVKKRVLSGQAVEREMKNFAKKLVDSRERELYSLLSRLLKAQSKHQRRMLDKPVGPVQ